MPEYVKQLDMLSKLLQHPLTYGLSVDDPRTTFLRRRIIHSKPFLRKIYSEWYSAIMRALGHKQDVLELGSGAGFFREHCPHAITSEVFATPGVAIVADACNMPFIENSLDAIVMTDVFHHIPNVSSFLTEATRCIKPGGKIIMIEPWRTPWSEWVYTNLHSEPFIPQGTWEIPRSGPLSGANGALPWIVFERDRALFSQQFPQWHITGITPLMPIAYLLSGGVSMRSLMPGLMYRPIRALEKLIGQRHGAMFALIELELGL
jgi:SAM-dependent methyltransferase